MNGVRARTGVLPPLRSSAGAALAPARPKAGAALSRDTWELIAKFGSSSVPKYSPAKAMAQQHRAPTTGNAKVVEALNAVTMSHVDEGLQSAPARLAAIAPLLSGATDAQKATILEELGLKGVPVAEAMAAIDAMLQQGAVHTALWVRPDFTVDADFKATVEKRLGTEVISVEPNELKGAVDGWSFGWTHGRLVDLVPEHALKTKQVVTTAAVPNDPLWQTPFNPAATIKEYPFDKDDGSDPVAQVMMTGVVECTATAAEDYRAAAIPMNNGTSFVAVVPAIGTPVSEIIAKAADPHFFDSFEPTRGIVYVPKMRVVGATDISKSLGPATKGPYAAVGSAPLTLDAALSATSIKLDEQGIAHAGGSSAQLAGAAAADHAPEEVIECARPFLFMLRNDATGLIVAAGVYRGPQTNATETSVTVVSNSRAPKSSPQR